MRPDLETFTEVAELHGGNITAIAKAFKVSRRCVYNWIDEDPEFERLIRLSRRSIYDMALQATRVLLSSIPIVDENGTVTGWSNLPDSPMARYVLGSLGKDDGFGNKVDVTTNGKDINCGNLFRVLTKEEIENFNEHFDNEY